MLHQECKNIILIALIGQYMPDTCSGLKISRTTFFNKATRYKVKQSYMSFSIIILLI